MGAKQPGESVREILIGTKIDGVRRFKRSQSTTVHNAMFDLKTFGYNGRRYWFATVYHQQNDQTVVVRLA